MQIYAINFNLETLKIEADLHEIQYDNSDEQYDQLLKLLNSDGLEVLDYNDEIAILVDDRGFEKKNNPVFEVVTEDNIKSQLAGKVLFVRNIYNEYSTDFGSITLEDVTNLKNNLKISLMGVIQNPI